MAGVVLDENGRATIFNRASGQTLVCAVPTALENVKLGGGVWVHGKTGEPWTGAEVAETEVAPADPILLHEEDTLPLPAPEVVEEPVVDPDAPPAPIRPVSDEHRHVPAHNEPDPLGHDGNGKKGGSKPNRSTDPERDVIKKALKAKGIKFFGGAPTDKLKEILAAS